jgi:succinate dehydrogenase flavin-adding protein (antitoxin of CptAB toxin-antitoxin module)
MRELDELLLGYFEHTYGGSSEAEKAAFRELLALPDPDLAGILLGLDAIPRGVSAVVIERIRRRTDPGRPRS